MNINVNDLVVGKRYLIDIDFWGKSKLLFCGTVVNGKRIKYRFTYGPTVESWIYYFNFVACKSSFKVLQEV